MKLDPDQLSPQHQRAVLDWYQTHGRHQLPWQIDKTAYRVWLSEIMLQQTQVSTVIPYYERFLNSFPDITALATATIDEVLQHWQGLGYYARARNLHRAAQIILDEYQGEFPRNLDQVLALPGIGRSTAGAILTFACGQSWPILDGNVKRVLARLFQVDGWYGKSWTMNELWQIAEALTPTQKTSEYNQAMMDLGAMVCVRSRPKCESCPLSQYCLSYRDGTQSSYPAKKPAKVKPQKQTLMLVHRYREAVLLYRRPSNGIWGGLWSLPEVDSPEEIEGWQNSNTVVAAPPAVIKNSIMKHQFTHFSLDISIAMIEMQSMPAMVADQDSVVLVSKRDLSDYGLPAPVRKLLTEEIDSF